MIKKILLIMFALLLIPSVMAYSYTANEDSLDNNGNNVTATYISDINKTIYHISYEDYLKQTGGSKTDYTNYIEEEVNSLVIESIVQTTRSNFVPEFNQTLDYDSSYGDVKWLGWIIGEVKSLINKVLGHDDNFAEICKKDNSYSFCLGAEL